MISPQDETLANCPSCGSPLVESDQYLARIMEQETHWFCPKGCDTRSSPPTQRGETVTDEAVEAVARAICIGEGGDPDRVSAFIKMPRGEVPDLRHDRLWKNYETAARAAIAALSVQRGDRNAVLEEALGACRAILHYLFETSDDHVSRKAREGFDIASAALSKSDSGDAPEGGQL